MRKLKKFFLLFSVFEFIVVGEMEGTKDNAKS